MYFHGVIYFACWREAVTGADKNTRAQEVVMHRSGKHTVLTCMAQLPYSFRNMTVNEIMV